MSPNLAIIFVTGRPRLRHLPHPLRRPRDLPRLLLLLRDLPPRLRPKVPASGRRHGQQQRFASPESMMLPPAIARKASPMFWKRWATR